MICIQRRRENRVAARWMRVARPESAYGPALLYTTCIQEKSLTDAISVARDVSQTDRAVLGIRDRILRGHFRPGERLTELTLVEALGVSRTPVRAALQKLAGEGLLESTQPSGYLVRGFTEAQIFDGIEVRGVIEGLAARMAAERGVPQPLLARMRDCLDEIDSVFARDSGEQRLERYSLLNARFHEMLLQAAASEVVERALTQAMSLPWASHSAFVPVQARIPAYTEILETAQRQHRAILEALEDRSSARVEPLVREHARIARRNFELVLRNAEAMDHWVGAPLLRRRGGA